MWQLKSIELKNLFSHVDTTYEFKQGVCTVIFGENKTDVGAQNNGAGKSTIFEGITIALTNKSLRDLKKESFINREAESCRIALSLENMVLNSTLKIVRQFFRGSKSAKVELWENGELNSDIVSVDEANKRVIDLIGISREDLLRYFIISQDNNYTFFTAGDVEKKEVLNRITSADMINPIMDDLAQRKKEKSAEIDVEERAVVEVTTRRDTLDEQRQEMLENDDTDAIIGQLKESNKELTESNEEIQTKIAKWKKKQTAAEKEIKCIEIPNTDDLKKQRKSLKSEIEELEGTITDDKRILRKLEAELGDVITCPKCGEEFIQSELGLTYEQAKELKKETEKHITDTEKQLDDKQTELKNVKKLLADADKLSERVTELEDDVKRAKRQQNTLSSEIEDNLKSVERNEKKIAELKSKKLDNKQLQSLEKRIKECEDELVKHEQVQLKLNEELQMIQYWQYYMGKAGFQTYLANRSISVIEGITNSFLRKFNSDLSVNINGFKILRDGSVREKIEVFALSKGVDAEAFMSKSGGERGRINLAGVLGIQHLINMSTNGKGLDLLVLDETFSGIDTMGQENIIKILEHLGVTILMITQNVSSEFNNENKLVIVKENGISRIV